MTSETEHNSIVLAFCCLLQINGHWCCCVYISNNTKHRKDDDDDDNNDVIRRSHRHGKEDGKKCIMIIVVFNDLTNGLRLIEFFHWVCTFRLNIHAFFFSHSLMVWPGSNWHFYLMYHCDGISESKGFCFLLLLHLTGCCRRTVSGLFSRAVIIRCNKNHNNASFFVSVTQLFRFRLCAKSKNEVKSCASL